MRAVNWIKQAVLLAFLPIMMLTGIAPAAAAPTVLAPAAAVVLAPMGEIGGSTGGQGEDTGSTVIGGGSPGGTPVDIGGLDSVESIEAAGHPWYKNYRYGSNIAGCKAGAVLKWDMMLRNSNGTYRYDYTGCDYPQESIIRAWDNTCVRDTEITALRNRPDYKVLLDETYKTQWGKGDKTVAGCEASQQAMRSVKLKVTDSAQYQIFGETHTDILYVKEYLNVDPKAGRIPEPVFHSSEHAKTVNRFDNRYTLNCEGFYKDWRAYEGLPCDNDDPGRPAPGSSNNTDLSSASYQCVVGESYLDRKSTDIVDIMRDGDNHEMAWGNVRVTGDRVSDVEWKSTHFEVWNAPQLGGPYNGRNTLDITVGGKKVIDHAYEMKEDADGKVVTKSVPGKQQVAALRAYKSSWRGHPVMIQPVWEFEATMPVKATEFTSIDPLTGDATTSETFVLERQAGTCRGEPVASNVMKAMNDSL